MVWMDRSLSILKPFLVQFFTSSDTNKVLSCFQWRISWPTIWHFQQDASDISLIGGRFNILNKVSGYWRTCMHKQESQFYNISDNGRPINIKVKQVWRTIVLTVPKIIKLETDLLKDHLLLGEELAWVGPLTDKGEELDEVRPLRDPDRTVSNMT